MNYKMYLTDQVSKEVFDISTLVHDIEHTTSLFGQPGKLTFLIEKDPNDILQISCGSLIQFWYQDFPVFYGYVFKIGTDRTEAYKVTAYDQMRYLQNHDYLLMKDMTMVDVFNKVCSALKLNNKVLGKAKLDKSTLDEKHFADVSYFEILQHAMNEANNKRILISTMNEDGTFTETYDPTKLSKMTPALFFIRDNFGTLELNDIESNVKKRRVNNDEGTHKLGWYGGQLVSYNEALREQLEPLIIGDESLLTDYKYELDIDENTYNEIYVMYNDSDNKDKQTEDGRNITTSDGKKLAIAKNDPENMTKYGTLRSIQNVKSVMNKSQLEEYAKLFLNNYSSPSKTMKIEALGFNGLNAGDGFLLRLSKLNLEDMVYILSATHHYGSDIHTMSLEVSTHKGMLEIL